MCVVNGLIGVKRMISQAWAHEQAHHNGWYSGLVVPISSIVGLLLERAESLITK